VEIRLPDQQGEKGKPLLCSAQGSPKEETDGIKTELVSKYKIRTQQGKLKGQGG